MIMCARRGSASMLEGRSVIPVVGWASVILGQVPPDYYHGNESLL